MHVSVTYLEKNKLNPPYKKLHAFKVTVESHGTQRQKVHLKNLSHESGDLMSASSECLCYFFVSLCRTVSSMLRGYLEDRSCLSPALRNLCSYIHQTLIWSLVHIFEGKSLDKFNQVCGVI